MGSAPYVSVVIPAFRAETTIRRAIESVLHSGLPVSDVEIVIASDDGRDYAALVPRDFRLTQAAPGPVASGVGAARNRAVGVATGQFLAFLDADDTWEPGYLSAALATARLAGLVFTPTRVLRNGSEILRTLGGARMTLHDLASTGASHHPVVARGLVGRFRDGPSQDVLHAVELLTMHGGSAAASARAYEIHIRDGSVSRSAGFARKVDNAYREIAREIATGGTRVPPAWQKEAAEVFHAKRALNSAFARSSAPGFYEFVAERRGVAA